MKRLLIVLFAGLQIAIAAKLDTLQIQSAATGMLKKAVVVQPEGASPQAPLPVVYLLHGWSGSYKDWPSHMDLRPLADRYHLFIVCPDGGYDGWYVDSPILKYSNYESHIICELIPAVEEHYAVRRGKSARAICGLSMGGHGSLYLALRNPDMFVAASSLSGAVDLIPLADKYGIADKLGPLAEYPKRWQQASVLYLVARADTISTALFIDCGVDDFTIDMNRRLHKLLLNRQIDHQYIERPGRHSWKYWTKNLTYHLLFFKRLFGN